jgi:hypothetical protein
VASAPERLGCEPEVPDFAHAGGGAEDVRGLEVAVDDLAPVRVIKAREHLREDGVRLGHGQAVRLRGKNAVEPVAVDILHRDEVPPGVLACIVDAHDVRVVELGQRAALARKAAFEAARGGERGREHLQRAGQIEPSLPREVNFAHRPRAEEPFHDVVAQPCAGGEHTPSARGRRVGDGERAVIVGHGRGGPAIIPVCRPLETPKARNRHCNGLYFGG